MKEEISHLEIPSNGVMVREEYELAQLADNCIYVLPSNVQLDGKLVQKHLDDLTRWGQFVNKYELEVWDELPCMCNHPKLDLAFKKESYNLILGMNELGGASGKQYLLVKTDEDRLSKDIALMLRVAEKVTKQSVHDLMLQHATHSPDFFFRFTEHIWESKNFWKNYVTRRINEFFQSRSFAVPPSYSYLKEKLGLEDILTHRKKLELQKKFIENLKAIKKNENDEIAKAEVNLVLECLNINNRDMLTYLEVIPESDIEQFCNKLIPQRIAEHSEMKMEVRWIGRTNVRKPSDGAFRLFLCKNGTEQAVHFKRRSSFVLYLIYLMDVFNSESVDTLNIKNDYEDTFCKLFKKVYCYEGMDNFRTMFGKGTSEQELLRHCFSDIRRSIGNACEMLHETATPYILNDAHSHLYILKQNVVIDKRLTASAAGL